MQIKHSVKLLKYYWLKYCEPPLIILITLTTFIIGVYQLPALIILSIISFYYTPKTIDKAKKKEKP